MNVMSLLRASECIGSQALRQLKSIRRSPRVTFRPIPNDFVPGHARKTLPKGGEQ